MRTINYKVSYEKMISRLPALFAYLEIDEQGTCNIVSASNGVQGNYGKIVANILIPKNCYFNYVCSDEIILEIKDEKEYSYRTIIDTYYKAISDKQWERTNGKYDDPFLSFVETGIGKKYVGLSREYSGNKKCGVYQTTTFPLAPDYIYLGEAQTLLDKMLKKKKQLDFYNKHSKFCTLDKAQYEQLKKEYELSNGDKLIAKLKELVDEAEKTADSYLEYSKHTNMTLNFNVNLVNTIKDLGMVTPYIGEWVGGKRYYEGDVVYYVDDNGYGMTWECVFENGGTEHAKTDEFGRKYTEGHYDANTELILFDNNEITDDGKTMRNWKPQTLNWVKRNERWVCTECGRTYYSSKEDCPTSCICGNTNFCYYKYADDMKDTVTISGECDSHLTSLRRFETYMSRDEVAEIPDQYNDWLWYYRTNRIMNREEKYDEVGNIGVMYDENNDGNTLYGKGVEAIIYDKDNTETQTKNTVWDDNNEYIVNLAAWGDAITNITAVNNEHTGKGIITFEYTIGGHLKARRGVTIKVNADFTIDGTTYKKGDKVPYSIYTQKGNSKFVFVVNNKFTYGGTEFKEGDSINLDTYLTGLDEKTYEVAEEFTIDSKTFNVGDKLTLDEYNELTEEYQEKCKNNQDNVSFTFKKPYYGYHGNSGDYVVNDVVNPSDYECLTEANRNKCKFIVEKSFSLNFYKHNGELDRTVDYNKNDELYITRYENLSSENKKNIIIQAKEAFTTTSYYSKNDVIYKAGYDSLTVSAQKDPNLFTIKVLESFYAYGDTYNVGDKIDKDKFIEIITKNKDYKDNFDIIADENFLVADEGKTAREYETNEYIDFSTYKSLPSEKQAYCTLSQNEWISTDDDGNRKYYFTDYCIDTDSPYGKNMGVKYTESYIYYKGDMSMIVIETFGDYTVVKEFTDGGKTYSVGYKLTEEQYKNISVTYKNNEYIKDPYFEGTVLSEDEYAELDDESKKKCRHVEESIWSLVNDGIFEKYVNGEYDKDYIPSGIDADENYYKLYDKMKFYYDIQTYTIRLSKWIRNVPYRLTNFTTTADITHADIEESPLIRYDYYNGVSFQPKTNTDDVYIERGVTQAFEKYFKLGEIKTFEDFENYGNGGFFIISKEDIDLG